MARVLCAMSGGVDSSVAAALLLEAGHDVIGVFLRLGSGAETGSQSRGCCSINDARDAARVAALLGIPFYALNYQTRFETIIDYFVDEYNSGRTPNPCARCNQWLKFGSLMKQADELGCEWLATGHYARVDHSPASGSRLRRGRDTTKDQSYFLFGVTAESLSRTLFPVGDYTKDAIRRIAAERELPVASKPDSQEICFVPNDDYRTILRARTPERFRSGPFVSVDGEVLGEHEGHQNFTIGQRRGLGRAFGEPKYVVAIDAATNRVTLGTRAELAMTRFEIRELNWLSVEPPGEDSQIEAEVQIRYRSGPVPSRLRVTGADTGVVELQGAVDAVTPGQAAVFYDGDIVIGGGWIV